MSPFIMTPIAPPVRPPVITPAVHGEMPYLVRFTVAAVDRGNQVLLVVLNFCERNCAAGQVWNYRGSFPLLLGLVSTGLCSIVRPSGEVLGTVETLERTNSYAELAAKLRFIREVDFKEFADPLVKDRIRAGWWGDPIAFEAKDERHDRVTVRPESLCLWKEN